MYDRREILLNYIERGVLLLDVAKAIQSIGFSRWPQRYLLQFLSLLELVQEMKDVQNRDLLITGSLIKILLWGWIGSSVSPLISMIFSAWGTNVSQLPTVFTLTIIICSSAELGLTLFGWNWMHQEWPIFNFTIKTKTPWRGSILFPYSTNILNYKVYSATLIETYDN